MSTTCLSTVCQIISLLVFKSFLLYLLIASFIGLLQKIFINIYLNKKYPYLHDKDIEPLDKATKVSVFKNVKALIFHKLGEASIHQTDNIIISTFINWLAGRLLVFKKSNKSIIAEIISIYLSSVIGLGLNLLIMYICVDILSVGDMLSKIIATGIVFFFNFLVRKLYIYK